MDSNELRKYQEKRLSEAGWIVECWSPFEIRTNDGSFATGEAAIIVLQSIMSEHETEEDLIETLVERGFPNGHKLDGDPTNGLLFVGIADMLYDELAYVREMNVEMFEVIAKLAKIRCLKKAPKDLPQIEWPTGVSKE